MTDSPTRTSPVLAAALVVAPALMGAALLVDITPQADSTRELLTLIDERPDAWALGQLLFFLAALAWAPAGLALMRLFGRRARVGRLAAVAVAVGGVTVLPVDAAGLYLRHLTGSGIPLDQQVELAEAVEGSATLLAFEVVHVVGLFVGLLLVGVVMLRGRVTPRWAGVLVLAGMVGMLGAPGRAVLTIAVVALVAGFAGAAARLLRVPAEEWSETPPSRPENLSSLTTLERG